MSDARGPQTEEPTEEELKAYLTQLRDADPAEVVAQAYTMLGTGAEVKLGRSDARVLIDAMAALAETAADRLDADLVTRMRNGVVQLQTAQVQAERQAAGGGAQGDVPQTSAPQPPPGAPGQGQPGSPEPGEADAGAKESVTNRLWIPGRDPR